MSPRSDLSAHGSGLSVRNGASMARRTTALHSAPGMAGRRRRSGVTTGTRIRLHRRRAGLTQEVLAGLAGVSPSWISQVERGVRAPDSLRCLIPVARVLRVNVIDLIESPRTGAGGEGEK